MNFKKIFALATFALVSAQASAAALYTFDFTSSTADDSFTTTVSKSRTAQTFSQELDLLLPTSGTDVLSTTFNFDTTGGSGKTNITNGLVSLYAMGSTTAIGTYSFGGGTSSSMSFTNLAGDYYFIVSGNLAAGYAGSYEVDVSVSSSMPPASAVPEPANAALLLAGLGLMGFMVVRRKQA